ncbi:MAG: dihydrolipoamide dehydrogenase [Hyphomonadaceae bacterium]|nr:MAG: dihydrolipoamide dehydrogenase [Hyphomonadaceae bacterium]KAF0186767.1 MAG: dihydrolipoamide dehydrogenase [Hyphomonadaceae bacterium]
MSEMYDVVIIGGGPGGYNCAIRAGQLGLKTAIIEARGTLGGTCLNVGCIPSKALLHASEAFESASHHFKSLGVDVAGVKLNLPQMMAQKDEVVDGLTKGIEFLMKKNKVTYIKGFGRIISKGKVAVDFESATTELATKNIVIATGSEVMPLPNIVIDEEKIISSTGALKLGAVPKSMVVIGAGVIGLELGSVWRRLGAEVTIIEFLDRITPGIDGEIAKALQRTLTKQGMKFELGQKVTSAIASKKGVTLTYEPAAGGDAKTFDTDVVLVAIGRRPFTSKLGLENVGIEVDKRGFIAHNHWKTSADGIWVIGDVTHGPMLAHKAEEEGLAVAECIAGLAGHMDYDIIPAVVYTNPEVAAVGKTEEELKAAGVEYKIGKFQFMANSRARTNHTTDGLVKILEDKATLKILGVHMMGTGVGEMIGEAALAMAFGASAEDIARTCHAHPTMSEAIKEAAKAVDGWVMQS